LLIIYPLARCVVNG